MGCIPHLSTSCFKSLCGKHGSSKSKDAPDAKLPIQEERCMISPLENENSLLQPLEWRPTKTASKTESRQVKNNSWLWCFFPSLLPFKYDRLIQAGPRTAWVYWPLDDPSNGFSESFWRCLLLFCTIKTKESKAWEQKQPPQPYKHTHSPTHFHLIQRAGKLQGLKVKNCTLRASGNCLTSLFVIVR